MFGIVRPRRHHLGEHLGRVWVSHLCGLCLTLRDNHGQAARAATNVDGVILSVLVAAQADGGAATRNASRDGSATGRNRPAHERSRHGTVWWHHVPVC